MIDLVIIAAHLRSLEAELNIIEEGSLVLASVFSAISYLMSESDSDS